MKRAGRILSLVIVTIMLCTAVCFADGASAGNFKLVEAYPKDGATGTARENVGVKLYFDAEFSEDVYKRQRLYCEVPFLSFDQESRRLQGSSHEKDRCIHQYQRQKRHEVLLQGSGQSLRRGRQACRENRTQAVQVRKQNLDEREIQSGQPD